nr:RNA-directed DNA polymerase, eukaryota [Tanacetum cinerariifolium]
MGNYRTKEDDVAKISTSIFVTNFPESFSAKDLFQSCKQYGHVVDTFIPNKRSKADKRFRFVRFINVFNDERLVNNLCTVWNDHLKLHASIARFNRAPLKENNIREKEGGMSGNMECGSFSAMVLDDECLFSKDVTNSLMGRVKDFFSLSNLKIAITNEGFDDINICYMGELWVMLEFASCKSKDLFRSNVGAGSWFLYCKKRNVDDQEESCFHSRRLCIFTKSHSNIFDSFKIAFRGKVYWIRAKEVSGWILEIMEVSDDDEQYVEDVKGGDTVVHEVGNHREDSDVDEVLETMFNESSGQKKKPSEDPFGIYPLLDKQRKNNNVEEPLNGSDDCSDNMGTKPDDLDLRCSVRFKNSVAPRTGGSILCLMKEVVKETKMESMELITIKSCWGNYAFDFVHSDAVVMMMGNFHEVRFKSHRFRLLFNKRGADMFNSFISNASLEEVLLGGYTYTWCHKSASKMSKLDRFLISKNLMHKCPNICVITLDRFILDHRPILLRESSFDYGPTPFRFFHYWMEVDGFNEFVIDSWREWINVFKNNSKAELILLKGELQAVDGDIDDGNGSDEVVSKRTEIINSTLRLNKIRLRKWLKRLRLSGPLRETKTQIENPDLVKDEFVQHFSSKFGKPTDIRVSIDINFPKVLSSIQKEELECDVSKEELKRMVWDCGMDKSLGCNSSFIALIPKTPRANMVKDFRPIILIGCMYKIIAKILTNRLVGVIGYIVNEVQSAFIADRQILDGPFILNEVMHWCMIKKKQALIFKVNFEKAYDLVRWDFLDEVLQKFGFSNKWHDAVFIGHWNDSNINTLVNVLECFYRASSLRINMCNSKIMGVHVEGDLVKHAVSKLGCLILNTSFVYLGTKVGGKMSRVKEWNEVVDKVVSRLSKWKMKTLSIRGRLTLFKSVLRLIPIFHMSLYRVSLRVLQLLESICNCFFNGNDLGSKKASWINWSNVLADKAKGGLGVSSLYALNRGLMIKWLCRFYAQNTSLWVRVVKAIHGEDEGGSEYFVSILFMLVKHYERDMVREVGLVPMSDRYIWSLEGSGDFSVASIRKVIDDKFLLNVSSKTRWVKYMPIKDYIKMIKEKCYNIHQDLISVREKLDEGLLRFPDCKKLNMFCEKFKETTTGIDNDDTTGIDKESGSPDYQMGSDSPAMKNKERNEDVHHILNEDDKVDNSCPTSGVCSVIEGDEVKLSEVEDVENEKQQIGNEDDRVVDDSDTTIPDSITKRKGVKFIEMIMFWLMMFLMK